MYILTSVGTSTTVEFTELNREDPSQRLASIFPTLKWWGNINLFGPCRKVLLAWSIGTLECRRVPKQQLFRRGGGTFEAVTPCYRTERAHPKLMTRAQQEITILRISGFDILARQPFQGSRRWFVLILLPPFCSQVIWCLKPGGRFISIPFVSLLIRKRLWARTEYNWSMRTHTYGECFKYRYFVYVMTKGEELSAEVSVLEKLLQVTMNKEEFLSNITHCRKYGIWLPVFRLDFIPWLWSCTLMNNELVYFFTLRQSPGTYK